MDFEAAPKVLSTRLEPTWHVVRAPFDLWLAYWEFGLQVTTIECIQQIISRVLWLSKHIWISISEICLRDLALCQMKVFVLYLFLPVFLSSAHFFGSLYTISKQTLPLHALVFIDLGYVILVMFGNGCEGIHNSGHRTLWK